MAQRPSQSSDVSHLPPVVILFPLGPINCMCARRDDHVAQGKEECIRRGGPADSPRGGAARGDCRGGVCGRRRRDNKYEVWDSDALNLSRHDGRRWPD